MGEGAVLAHPSISTLRPTTANEVLYEDQRPNSAVAGTAGCGSWLVGCPARTYAGPPSSLSLDPARGVPLLRFGSG
jgi:hypothetical protein